ncbi:DgyrCDS1660 [Dimorphilus gyrociliatus]|uniref:DgyrCDS1660 n=1 Tax=Dimorphilus gyrociliatus TaxID=2664684 RepID=A0A7I8V824_9ANNE|nr:DgyrCDS1660 [Dimorphilus gyrociliatus]
MGNGSSVTHPRVIYVEIASKVEKLVFTSNCSGRDIQEQLAQLCGASRYASVSLKNQDGSVIALSPAMPSNSQSAPYKVVVIQEPQNQTKNELHLLQECLIKVVEQFKDSLNKAFSMDEVKEDVNKRLTALERRLEIEGMKAVDIEKCKKEIYDIKEQISSAQRKVLDYQMK